MASGTRTTGGPLDEAARVVKNCANPDHTGLLIAFVACRKGKVEK